MPISEGWRRHFEGAIASEIMHVAHPMISLQTLGIAETHVHIDWPDF